MITIFQYPQTNAGFIKTGDMEVEYTCPFCYAAIRWNCPGQMSPSWCPKCKEKLMDITNIIKQPIFRKAYHIHGEMSVMCGVTH